jgi:hypothetical protein
VVGDAHRVTDTTRIRVHQEADLPAFRCSPHAHTSKLRSALSEEPLSASLHSFANYSAGNALFVDW